MNNYSFDIGSITLEKANQRAMKPNKDGIYEGLVMMVLGAPSRNGKLYEIESMVQAISSPDSCFYKKLIAGQAAAEICHPYIKDESDLGRIATIDMTKVSHIVMRMYTGKPTEKGHIVVYGDVKPYGPYKDVLIESLESPILNTAFSLRSLVEKIGTTPEGYINQRVMALICIDGCECPGYAAASKIHSASDEGLSIPLQPGKNQPLMKQLVSQEVISDHQLEDMLGLDKIKIMHHSYDITNKNLMSDGKPVDIFHTLFKG